LNISAKLSRSTPLPLVEMVGVSRPTVILWRNRYAQAGIGGLDDLARSGRPPVIDDLQVVVETLAAPPDHLGVTRRFQAGNRLQDLYRT